MDDENDESIVVECTKSAIPSAAISAHLLTSSVTVTSDTAFDTEEAFLALQQTLQSRGYEIKLPPNRVESNESASSGETMKKESRRKGRGRISVGAFICSVCVVLVLSILTTYTLTAQYFDRKITDLKDLIWDQKDDAGQDDFMLPQLESSFPELELLKFLFDQYAIEEIDEEASMTAVLKAYAAGTGDIYAEYYTSEEVEALQSDSQGEMEGIGVSVVNDKVDVGGISYSVLTVISVIDNSPALSAGLRVGDCIYTVTDENGQEVSVDAIGYDKAISCVRGPAGTRAHFTALRFSTDGAYEVIPFDIERAPITAESVTGRVHEQDATVGIVKISQFDLTTPPQFHATMDALIAQGCQKFVFDVRYNPGGALQSVEAVLSTLLQKGDVMISTVYSDGSRDVDVVKEVRNTLPGYDVCDVTTDDIGKYRGYEYVVLVNEYTASAGELFASNLRDHELATLVGTTTFGKGCMQSMFDLSYFGVEGALKLTTAWYQPPSGENYHDVGIVPHVEIEMDEALLDRYNNIYLIPDAEDTQLAAAITALNK